MAMIGMAKHGTNCTSAYGRRSFANLHHKHADIVFSAGVHTEVMETLGLLNCLTLQ